MACDPEALKMSLSSPFLTRTNSPSYPSRWNTNSSRRASAFTKSATGRRAYVMMSGRVRVTTVDEDHQEVVVDEPSHGEFFGFASMLDQTPHQTNAAAVEETSCLEVDRNDILTLLQRKPHAGMDMLTVLGRQFHARSSWSVCAPAAIPTKSSKRKPPLANAPRTPSPVSAVPGLSSFLFWSFFLAMPA